MLTGGGARAAHQVGVLQAIARMLPRDALNPFRVISGTSAGAINAAALASNAVDFRVAVGRLVKVWARLRVSDVYRADASAVLRGGLRWLAQLASARCDGRAALSLLDSAPLARLIARCIDFSGIRAAIEAERLDALCVTASNYGSGQSVSFFEGRPQLAEWHRAYRRGVRVSIAAAHVHASAAIPFVFPPVKVVDDYYGDGTMLQLAPFSPALHLGAERILVVAAGKRQVEKAAAPAPLGEVPTLARIAGHVLDCIFLDSLETDLERLQRVNETLSVLPEPLAQHHRRALRKVETFVITPGKPFALLAAAHAGALPPSVRFLMRCIGAMKHGGGSVLSYLLFERHFTRALMRLGCDDAMSRRADILRFLGQPPSARARDGDGPRATKPTPQRESVR